MNINQAIARTLRLAERLATLTGNHDAAAGKNADEIAKAISDARYALIQGCLAEQRQLRSEGATVRLPILRDLQDAELVATRADLTRKGKEARRAKAKADVEDLSNAKRGIRPMRRVTAPTPVRDPVLERLREIQSVRREQIQAVVKGLGKLRLFDDRPEAAE